MNERIYPRLLDKQRISTEAHTSLVADTAAHTLDAELMLEQIVSFLQHGWKQ